jgi:hypothetical protein
MSMSAMSQQGRRRLVAVVWIAVGVMLIWRGLPYAGLREAPDVAGLTGSDRWIALAIALVIGVAKGFTLLKKGARRAAAHIVKSGPTAPAWSVFSPYMIGLVLLMIAFGVALRTIRYDAHVKAWLVGSLYPGIGIALIIGGLLATTVPPLESRSA